MKCGVATSYFRNIEGLVWVSSRHCNSDKPSGRNAKQSSPSFCFLVNYRLRPQGVIAPVTQHKRERSLVVPLDRTVSAAHHS